MTFSPRESEGEPRKEAVGSDVGPVLIARTSRQLAKSSEKMADMLIAKVVVAMAVNGAALAVGLVGLAQRRAAASSRPPGRSSPC